MRRFPRPPAIVVLSFCTLTILASLLTTAGSLVFAGEPNGRFNAFNARTGEQLWSFQTGNGIHSNPVTYSVNGKQYIAVPTGWGGWVEGYAPEMYGAPRGTAGGVRAAMTRERNR